MLRTPKVLGMSSSLLFHPIIFGTTPIISNSYFGCFFTAKYFRATQHLVAIFVEYSTIFCSDTWHQFHN